MFLFLKTKNQFTFLFPWKILESVPLFCGLIPGIVPFWNVKEHILLIHLWINTSKFVKKYSILKFKLFYVRFFTKLPNSKTIVSTYCKLCFGQLSPSHSFKLGINESSSCIIHNYMETLCDFHHIVLYCLVLNKERKTLETYVSRII